ncbi:MAG: hypothetical protein V7767_14170 [Leeuwenhoekiella sp.]
MDHSSAKYRITYEAFSKFLGNLTKAEDFNNLAKVVGKNLKYLFDYRLFRILITTDNKVKIFTFAQGKYWIDTYKKSTFDYEKKLLHTQIPFCEKMNSCNFLKYIDCDELLNPHVWGWFYTYNNAHVCASVVADDIKKFDQSDVEILNLLVDSFTTKFLQIKLRNDLNGKNKNLQKAIKTIEKKNEFIRKINGDQKKIIYSRTKEIRDKNDKLLEISKLNAHNVREPLSRILGLLEISEHYSATELKEEVFSYLKESALELDATLQNVIEMSSGEIDKLAVDNGY